MCRPTKSTESGYERAVEDSAECCIMLFTHFFREWLLPFGAQVILRQISPAFSLLLQKKAAIYAASYD